MEVESSAVNGNEQEAAKYLSPTERKRRKRRRCCLCCVWVTLACIILLGVVVTILALTVFKTKKPTMRVENLILRDLALTLNPSNVVMNITLGCNITVHNPNKIGMSYKAGRTGIYYRGGEVGESSIPAGKIKADSDKVINTDITVMADRMVQNKALLPDVFGGSLPLKTITKLKGKIIILRIFKFHVNTKATCDVLLRLSSRHVDRNCSYQATF